MKLLTITICLLWTAAAFSQDHAPTPEQCQADEKWWGSQELMATDATAYSPSVAQLSTGDLLKRAKELMACITVDTPNAAKYDSTAMVTLSLTTKRFGRYIQETGQKDRYLDWEEQQQKAVLSKGNNPN
jgi:hypothetical protein